MPVLNFILGHSGFGEVTAEVETVLKVNTHTYIEIGPPTELL